MENRLLRTDFFDRPGIQGLGCDYLMLLATCTVHPRSSVCGVVHWSAAAAKVVGFEHGVAVSGLRALAERNEIVFDEQTLESWPTDFFLVNQAAGGKNGLYDKERQRALSTVKSEALKKRYTSEAEATVGMPRIPALLLPTNLVSRFGSAGGKLMVSDAAAALALHCNPYLSAAGIGPLDIDLLALMTAQAQHAVAGAVERLAARRTIETDGDEYRIRRYLELPSKLSQPWQVQSIVNAADASDSKLGEAVLADLCRALHMSRRELRKWCRQNAPSRTGIVALCTETASASAKKTTGFSSKSMTSCTHNNTCTQHNTTTQHNTPPAAPAGVVGVGGLACSQEKTQNLIAGGWSFQEADTIVDAAQRLARTPEIAAALVDHFIVAVDRSSVKSLGGLLNHYAKQANAGVLVTTPVRRSKHWEGGNGGEIDEWEGGWQTGRSLRDIKAIQVALTAGDWAAAQAAAGGSLSLPPQAVIDRYQLRIDAA